MAWGYNADRRPLHERIFKASELDDAGCWIWGGGLNADGYGQMSVDSRTVGAHRISYVAFVGPIPQGFQVDHTCFVTACVNPSHLEAVTQAENLRRRTARYADFDRLPPKERRRIAEARAAA